MADRIGRWSSGDLLSGSGTVVPRATSPAAPAGTPRCAIVPISWNPPPHQLADTAVGAGAVITIAPHAFAPRTRCAGFRDVVRRGRLRHGRRRASHRQRVVGSSLARDSGPLREPARLRRPLDSLGDAAAVRAGRRAEGACVGNASRQGRRGRHHALARVPRRVREWPPRTLTCFGRTSSRRTMPTPHAGCSAIPPSRRARLLSPCGSTPMAPADSRSRSISCVRERSIWIPSLDIYVTAGDAPVPFADHLRALEARKGERILDRVRVEPEATFAQYTSRWEDMGNPAYTNPQPRGPGHIVGLTWDSAIRKFGIDRGAGVWSDEGNPDKVRFWFAFGELGKGVGTTWKSQRLTEGLPVMTTVFEEAGVRYEVEQFAYPLHGPPAERRGDMPMVLLQRLTVTELTGHATVAAGLDDPPAPASAVRRRRRSSPSVRATRFSSASGAGAACCSPCKALASPPWSGTSDYQSQQNQPQQKRIDATVVRRSAGQRNPPVRREAAFAHGDGRGRRGADGDRLCGRAREDAEVLVRVRRPWRAVPRAGAGRQRPVPRQPLARAPATSPARRLRAGCRHRPALLELRVQPDGHSVAGEPGRVRGLHALRPARLSRHRRRRARWPSSGTTRNTTGTSAATRTGSSTRRRCSTRWRRTTCCRRIAPRSSSCCRRV